MEVLYWVSVVVFLIMLLNGLNGFFHLFRWSRHENGVIFTIKMIFFFILFIVPSQVKEHAPDYYGYAIWALVLYSLALLYLRFTNTAKHKEG